MLAAIEGCDGAGKWTQANKLAERIAQEQREATQAGRKLPAYCPALFLSFPDYEHSTLGPKIKHYLRGNLGKLHTNHPALVAMMFALERYEKREDIDNAMAGGYTIVCDRYTPSNLAHQAGKFYDGSCDSSSEWLRVLRDIEMIEYDVLGMPQPDLVFYLDLTPEQSQARTKARDSAPDLHQDDLSYLRNTRAVYQYLAGTYQAWHTVACFNADGTPRTVDDVHNEIFNIFTAVVDFQESRLREDAFFRKVLPNIGKLPREE
jgi:dTMP kinase